MQSFSFITRKRYNGSTKRQHQKDLKALDYIYTQLWLQTLRIIIC